MPSVAHENVDYRIANYEWRTRHGTDLLNSWGSLLAFHMIILHTSILSKTHQYHFNQLCYLRKILLVETFCWSLPEVFESLQDAPSYSFVPIAGFMSCEVLTCL